MKWLAAALLSAGLIAAATSLAADASASSRPQMQSGARTAIQPLIDAGKIDEAKTQLQTALNTMVVTTDVIPLPKLRAETLLKEAQPLTEKKDRSTGDNDKLANQLKTVREQLQMAELLGYGKKPDFQPMYAQLESIEKTSAGGKSGAGWFDKIRKQIAEAF